MYYKRTLEHRIKNLAKATPAIVLTGGRQTGKTTLLKQLFPRHHYVSLDLPSVADQAENDPLHFLRTFPPPLVIDEVQYAPKLFRHIKVAIDEKRDHPGQFILTGSQKFSLMKEVSDSLAGRCVWIELEGFSLKELEQIARVDALQVTDSEFLSQAIVRGGFPELWVNDRLAPQDFYATYLATYLERDVRQLINVSSLRDFERFVRACAARNGQMLDRSAIANEVGVTAKTINSWLSVLTASNQIYMLEPWFGNIGKRLIKSPKLYMADTGLCAYLLGITPSTFHTSPYLGSLWESFVYAELRKQAVAKSAVSNLWYYRDGSQIEVDFLVTAAGRGEFIEAKWTEHPQVKDAKRVFELLNYIEKRKFKSLSSAGGWVVSRTANPYPLTWQNHQVQVVSLPELTGTLFPSTQQM
jgi:predicted AAA+ superfamily ATPase